MSNAFYWSMSRVCCNQMILKSMNFHSVETSNSVIFAIDIFYIFIHGKYSSWFCSSFSVWHAEQCLTVADFWYCTESESLWAVQTVKWLINLCWPGWKMKWSSSSSKGLIIDNSAPYQFITLSPIVWGQSLWCLALSFPVAIVNHVTLKVCSLETRLLNKLLIK